ncbi:MAG TPA: S8 family serine peptidase [Thermoleophilaceae bacterium]
MLPASAAQADPIPGQYIVVLEDGADSAAVAADHKRLAQAEVLDTYSHAVSGYSAKLSTASLREIEADPRVAYVTEDLEDDALLGKPGGGGTTQPTQMLPTGINRLDSDLGSPLAGDGSGDVNAAVAVYDSGIQTNHPDLNVAGGVNCLGAKYTGNDGTIGDQYGHGTHVAGIIGAKDDAIGVVGEAPGARLYSVRIGDGAGASSLSAQLCGIDWLTANAAALGIKVVNASTGLFGKADDGNCGYSAADVLHQAICKSTASGLLWVFGAGNTTGDLHFMPGASYDEVLAVTAIGDSNGKGLPSSTSSATCSLVSGKSSATYVDDKFASWSRYAISTADRAHTVAAPGICIRSTYKGSTYGNNSGTSMATPHAAGAAAMCIATLQCTGTPAETIQKLIADAEAYTQANPSYGFTGDPLRPVNSSTHYGWLVRAGLY